MTQDKIKLADFHAPDFLGIRCFYVDESTGAFSSESRKNYDDAEEFCSGFAQTVPLKGVKPGFAAIYIKGQHVEIRIGTKYFEVGSNTRCVLNSSWPISKTFELLNGDLVTCRVGYLQPVDDKDSDIFEYIASIINDPQGLKKFAYEWSAIRAGRQRALTKYGFTKELVDKIEDPFDVDHDVTD